MFASEIKEAEAASFTSGPSLNTLVDNMSESDGVSYIYYNLGGAANNINNYGYITPKQKFMGLREPHKYGYKFDGWYLDEHFSKKADVLTYEKANGYVVYAKWVRTINNEYSVEHYNYRSNKKAHTLALNDCDYDFSVFFFCLRCSFSLSFSRTLHSPFTLCFLMHSSSISYTS